MGNRATRKLALSTLHAMGYSGSLFTGRLSWELKNQSARRLLRSLGYYVYGRPLRPGDVIADCDGWNHIIAGFASYSADPDVPLKMPEGSSYFREDHASGYWLVGWRIPQFLFEDGRYSCGCPSGVEAPRTKKEIEDSWRDLDPAYIAQQKKLGWWRDPSQRVYDAVMRGEPICDEQGVRLPWVSGLSRETDVR